ncbi:MAG: histidine phosphatase family protein [Acidimicrobiaceae bacterium]|nr:histidine phosphatase family protein [Acidimicrobiaceae bacterium]
MSEDGLLPPEGFRQRGPLPTGTRLLMVRHGESRANAEGLAGGHVGDGGLTDLGRRQARALAERLAMSKELAGASAFYTSTMPRAVETGELLREVLAPLAPVRDDDLCEIGVGEGDGLTWAEFTSRFGSPDWDLDPFQITAPGGESLMGFYERCRLAIERLVQRHPGELVVLVVHGGFIEQAMKLYLGVDGAVRLKPRIENCSMTEIEFDGDRRRLLRYNDRAPLAAE